MTHERAARFLKRAQMPVPTLALAVLALALAAQPATARTFTLLHTFSGGADGATPQSALIMDANGNLYGTTSDGGSSNSGIIYKLDTTGNETVLYTFTGGLDGQYPVGGVLRDKAGNLYGTTYDGGNAPNLAGTIYKLDTSGKETVLYNFTGVDDGGNPECSLIADSAGNFYGTTEAGGTNNFGTVFKLDAKRNESVLYTVPGGPRGGNPLHGALVRDPAGNFYGTTAGGGGHAQGVVFKIDLAGNETVLHHFTGGADGGSPYWGLLRDSAGNLYGMTIAGGASNAGTVFKIDRAGKETVLYNFTGGADGKYPFASLTRDAASNLYGTTSLGGASGQGTVFKLDTKGVETVLYSFTGGSDGANPTTPVLRDAAGNLYGTTYQGGASGFGTVFKLTP